MNHWTPAEAQAAIEQITTRAAHDAEFRTLCLTDPAAAVRTATGRDLPEGVVLRFIDNAGADLTVVLPDLQEAGELDEAALEGVSGGLYKNLWADQKRKYEEHLKNKHKPPVI